jgi:hypothetical protein
MGDREYMREWNKKNRARVKAYRDKTRDARNQRRRELYASDPRRRAAAVAAERERRLLNPNQRRLRQYNLTADEYELMENNGCAICGAHPQFDRSVKLHIDHDHTTGRTRGLLCQPCNLAIGHLCDDPILAMAAADYLMGVSRAR